MLIAPIEFTRTHLPIVQGFECGEEVWSRLAADWIKSAPPFPGALKSIIERGNTVWLYMLEDCVVGFASLGTTMWEIPPPPDVKQEILYIPMMAVASAFQGKPDTRPRYAEQILGHVIEEARDRDNGLLGLLVSSGNRRAMRLYERVGFKASDHLYRLRGHEFYRMFLRL